MYTLAHMHAATKCLEHGAVITQLPVRCK